MVGLSEIAEDPKQTLPWLGLVLNHAAASQSSKRRANAIIDGLRESLSKAEIDVRLEQGKARDLMEVVREILGTPENSN
jgi:hypothetical protein